MTGPQKRSYLCQGTLVSPFTHVLGQGGILSATNRGYSDKEKKYPYEKFLKCFLQDLFA